MKPVQPSNNQSDTPRYWEKLPKATRKTTRTIDLRGALLTAPLGVIAILGACDAKKTATNDHTPVPVRQTWSPDFRKMEVTKADDEVIKKLRENSLFQKISFKIAKKAHWKVWQTRGVAVLRKGQRIFDQVICKEFKGFIEFDNEGDVLGGKKWFSEEKLTSVDCIVMIDYEIWKSDDLVGFILDANGDVLWVIE